ncbi:DNA-binding domain-containing protein, AraC-type [Rivularia sp. PCC 7116]|uniref:helix-turn-helix transcriptional regulator n=1 Tax=Rivularia sp. PCC 7116 TaxID=373994 RepID=UPI00029F457E|nr:AraC family transcriptional regulator [Rivularia sp. PCC 7116]AFY53326.1 DNA-binding domain-containing protein, AraC-type [Rivularia sp. PCC 7116]
MSVSPDLIISSDATGWDNISLAHYRQAAGSLPQHCSLHHEICINFGKPVVLEQIIDGYSEIIHSATTQVGIYPANTNKSFVWDSEAEFLLLYLKPSLLTQLSEEGWGKDKIEFVPQLTGFFDPLIVHMGLALKNAIEANGLGSRLYADSMANALGIHLLSRYSTQKSNVKQHKGGLSKQQLKQVLNYMNEHLDRNLSLAELAAIVRLSSYHFAHLFKQSMGIPPHQYHIQCRIERAKELLRRGDMAIKDIAQVVGFSSQGHFTYHFKRLTGITPKNFLH